MPFSRAGAENQILEHQRRTFYYDAKREDIAQSLPIAAATVILAALLTVSGCDAWTSGPDPPATVIQDIRVEPNPVPVDSSATFTVITKDSLNPDLQYTWLLKGHGEETNVPFITWVANVDPGEYSFSVHIRRLRGTYEQVQRTFRVTVVAHE